QSAPIRLITLSKSVLPPDGVTTHVTSSTTSRMISPDDPSATHVISASRDRPGRGPGSVAPSSVFGWGGSSRFIVWTYRARWANGSHATTLRRGPDLQAWRGRSRVVEREVGDGGRT